MLKRFLAFMLSFCILFGAVPVPTSFAEEGEQYALEEQLGEGGNEGEVPTEPVVTPEEEISELKGKLASTDYQAIKYAEGVLSEEEYAEMKAQRQAWRDRINELEEVSHE